MGHDMTEYETDRQRQERHTVRSEDLAVYRTPFQNSHIVPIWDQALTWEVALFDGYEALREKLRQDAAECFRDRRMQVLWILHQHYLCAVPSGTE